MGNNAPAAGYSHYSEPSRTHYTVHCYKHTWINVYDGYDKYWYDHYSNSTGNCSQCATEENERQETLARERAQRAKEEEEERVRKLKKRLEDEERLRQENERKTREIQRRKDEENLRRERQEKEKHRLKIQQNLIRESEEKIQKEIDRLKSIKTKNPYVAWKKCDTLKVVKEIGNKALECSVTGQIVLERVGAIKEELKESLKYDYKTVKPDIERYQRYGNEMKSMTNAFIAEFGSVFDETTDKQSEFNVFADDIKEARANKDQDDEEFLIQEIEDNIKALSTAIGKMKLKLLLMDQYYSKMEEDYGFFIDYMRSRVDEFENQKDSIGKYLDGIADGMKEKRELFKGSHLNENEVPKEFVEGKYDIINTAVLEKDVVIGTKRVRSKGGNCAVEGAVIGAGVGMIAGGIIGGIATAPAGAVGCIPGAFIGGVAGAVLGACIGSLVKKKSHTYTKKIMGKEKRMVATKIKNGGSVKLKVEIGSYDGNEHATALKEIANAMKKPIDNFVNEMKREKRTTEGQLEQFKAMHSDVQKMLQNINEFKGNVDDMKKILNEPNGISDSQRKQINKKWGQTSAKISGILQSMKESNNQ